MTKRNPLMDRRALFASAAAATLLAASGVSAASVPQRGGRLRMALSGASRSDSWTSGQGLFMQIARQGLVFDTLTEIAADGTLRGELATGWNASSDARVWTFDLRQDVTFHDGAPFTASDVVASAAGFDDGRVQALDTHLVQVTLDQPDPCLPMKLAQPEYYITPAHAQGSGVGTGLYRAKDFTPGRYLLTERVADHYKGEAVGWFDEVELSSIPAEAIRAEALGSYLSDAVDLVDATFLTDVPDVTLLPDSKRPTAAVSRDVMQPTQISTLRPLDNLRAAERWWFA